MKTDTYFNEFVDRLVSKNSNSLPHTLCLVHGTNSYFLRQILRDGIIAPNHCAVVGENLIFAFYGRPAYRNKDSSNPIYQTLHAPVYILLKEHIFAKATTAFPFDSGAFDQRLYSSFIPSEMALENFSFEPSITGVRALIECYFHNNDRYLRNAPLPAPNVDKGAFEAQALTAILKRQEVDDRLDDRASSIEIGLSEKIAFNSKNIEAIILPHEFAEDGDIGDILKSLGVRAQFYDFVNGFSWDQYSALILATIKQLYKSKNKL